MGLVKEEMNFYSCQIKNCAYKKTITTKKNFLFCHYLKHLRPEINEAVIRLNVISKPYHENRYALIHSLIDHSIVRRMCY